MTPTSIKIGVSGPYTAPIKSIFLNAYNNGLGTWVKEVNAQGGINGRMVQLVQIDNANSAEGGVAACKEAQSDGVFIVLNFSSTTSSVDCMDQAGIPVAASGSGVNTKWKSSFAFSDQSNAAKAAVSFLKSKYVNATGKKIGVTVSDNPTQIAPAAALEKELKKQGFNVVDVETTPSAQSSFVAEMQRMKDSGAQVVTGFSAQEALNIRRDAAAIGFKPQWVSGPDSILMEDVFPCATCQGDMGTRGTAPQDSPQFIAIKNKEMASSGASSISIVDVGEYSAATVVGKILQDAGKDLTRKSFVAASRALSNYTAGIYPPFTLQGKKSLVGIDGVYPMVCCQADNKTVKALGPPAVTFPAPTKTKATTTS